MKQIRTGTRVVLKQDLTNLDGSIVIKPAGTKGKVRRVVTGVAFVQFDGDLDTHQCFTWKLERAQ